MTDDRIEALESKVESLLRNTSPNIADSVKEIFERLIALEEAEKARLDAEHEELQQDEYDDDDYEDDDPEDDDDDEPSGECEHCQGTGFAKDDNNNHDDDDEQDEPCDKCGK